MWGYLSPVLVASQKAPEPRVAEPKAVDGGRTVAHVLRRVVTWRDFSFVGLRDQSAGLWAWIGLYPCSR